MSLLGSETYEALLMHVSSRKVHSVKVFDVTQNSTSDLEYGSQVAHVVLVRDKIEVASTPNTSDLTTYFTSR